MPYEDIEVRITRDGTVYVRLDGCSEERARSYRDFLEEIGPIHAAEIISRPDWEMPAGWIEERRELDEQSKRDLELGG